MINLVGAECNFVKTFIVQWTLLKTSGAAEVSWPGAILAILSFYDPWNTFKIYVATFCAPVLTGKHVLMIETFFSFFFTMGWNLFWNCFLIFIHPSFHDIVTYLLVKEIPHFSPYLVHNTKKSYPYKF